MEDRDSEIPPTGELNASGLYQVKNCKKNQGVI